MYEWTYIVFLHSTHTELMISEVDLVFERKRCFCNGQITNSRNEKRNHVRNCIDITKCRCKENSSSEVDEKSCKSGEKVGFEVAESRDHKRALLVKMILDICFLMTG